MNKKLISWMLSLLLIFSSGIVAFGAQDEDAQEVAATADFEFAKAVGIFSEETVPGESVKRIDLAECILKILLRGTELATEEGSLYFDDVDYNTSGYADAISKAGIMSGTGNRQFSPNDKVTYAQLLKIFVSFLGYDVKAQALGGYPSGYMAVATQLGITDKFAPYADSYVTWNTVATMFKSSLGVPLFQVAYYKDSTFIYTPNPSKDYLREYFAIQRYSNVINGVYKTNVLGYPEVEHDEIILGTTTFRYDPEVCKLSDKLGRKVEVFYKDEGTTGNILYFDEYDNNEIILMGDQVEGFDGGILYYNGKKERIIKINSDTNVIYNDNLCTTYKEDIFNVWTLSSMDGSLEAVDNNSDGIYDFIIIDAYESYVVGSITDNAIIPKYRTSAYVDISSYIDGKEILFYNYDNQPVSVEKVVKGSVISVSRDLDGKTTKIVVTTDTYTGEIQEIEVENGKHYLTIDGTRYNPSNVLSLNPQLESLRAGQRVTMMFNKDGLLSDVEALQFQIIELGYLYGAKTGRGLEASMSASIRVFSSGGFFKNFDFAKKVEVVSGNDTFVETPSRILALLGKQGDGDVTRQVIKFKKNEEGLINWINIADDNQRNVNSLYRYDLAQIGMNGSVRYVASNFQGKLLVSGTTVFSVPTEANRYNEDLYFVGNLRNNTDYAVNEAYGDEMNGKIAVSLVIERDSSGVFNNTPGYMLVESVTKAIDADGVPSIKIKGYITGEEREYFGDEHVFTYENGKTPQKGDIVKFTLDRENRISELGEFVFDESERFSGDIQKMFPTGGKNPSYPSLNEQYRFIYGKIAWSNDKSFVIEGDTGDGIQTEAYLKLNNYRYYTFDKAGSDRGIITRVDSEALHAYPEGAARDNYAIVFVNYGTPTDIIIYR